MSEQVPEWKLVIPVSYEECGDPYSNEVFDSTSLSNNEPTFLGRLYRTWCKACDSLLMDASEEI